MICERCKSNSLCFQCYNPNVESLHYGSNICEIVLIERFLPAKPNFASAPKRQNPFLFPCYGKQLNKKEQSSTKFLNSSINVLLRLEGTYP